LAPHCSGRALWHLSRRWAQQYNSDNYLPKPHGVATLILTAGERNSMWMTTFSLLPKWEFAAAAYAYYQNNDPKISDGYSTSCYVKYTDPSR
jgi:hypothetical protein